MKLLSSIIDAIHALEAKGAKKADLRIAYSNFTHGYLLAEAQAHAAESYSLVHILLNPRPEPPEGKKLTHIVGVQCKDEFPYDHIAVYSIECWKNPELLIELRFDLDF